MLKIFLKISTLPLLRRVQEIYSAKQGLWFQWGNPTDNTESTTYFLNWASVYLAKILLQRKSPFFPQNDPFHCKQLLVGIPVLQLPLSLIFLSYIFLCKSLCSQGDVEFEISLTLINYLFHLHDNQMLHDVLSLRTNFCINLSLLVFIRKMQKWTLRLRSADAADMT